MSETQARYTAVAIVLHWAIALAIAGMIALGWWMGDALEAPDTQAQAIAAYQLHKSIGLTILALSLLRLLWRLAHPAPPLPAAMPAWEKAVAKGTHWAFYALIIAMPLTGWLYVSAAWSPHDQRPLEAPTLYFGLFQVPHLFGLSNLADGARAAAAGALEGVHSKLAWGAIVLGALHVGAALKHHVINKDDVLTRMIPGLGSLGDSPPAPAPSAGRNAALIAGFAAIALAAGAALWAFSSPPAATPLGAPPTLEQHEGEHGEDHEISGPPEDAHDVEASSGGASPESSVWLVDRGASSIIFSGMHAGVPFQGRFASWRADIRFDPAALDQAAVSVTIDTGSASDGVALHDQSLAQSEWFDVANHPTATFRAARFQQRSHGAYRARGALTLKGRPLDIDLPFTLRIAGDRAVMDGETIISRRAADLGMRSDPDADYVSADIAVRVHVEARRAQ